MVGEERVHYLVVIEGAKAGEAMRLGADPIVIGRKSPANLVLDDPRVSRLHCRVWLSGDEVIVIDLGSTNGTYIDGKLAVGATPLPAGSSLEVGSHVVEHECRGAGDPPGAGAARAQP